MSGRKPGARSRIKILAQQREVQAIKLRIAGNSLPAIAKKLGVTLPGAHKIVDRAMKKSHRSAEHWRALLCEQTMALIAAWWPRAQKELEAAELVRGLSADIRKTMGLEAAPHLIVNNVDADTYIEQQIQTLAVLAGGRKTEIDPETESADRIIEAEPTATENGAEVGNPNPMVQPSPLAEASPVSEPELP